MKITVQVKRSELSEMGMDEFGLRAQIAEDLNDSEDIDYSGFNVNVVVTEDI
jgi:hypothetical protein